MTKINLSCRLQKDYVEPLFLQCQPYRPTSQPHQNQTPGNRIVMLLVALVLPAEEPETQHRLSKKLFPGSPEMVRSRRRLHLRRSVGGTPSLPQTHIHRRRREIQGSERVVAIHAEDISSTVLSRGGEGRRAEAHREAMVEARGRPTIDQAELRTSLIGSIT